MRQQKWRQMLHLEPLQGWLNDPNGLCFFKGLYHIYFQYAPDSAFGTGRKCWGHCESPDFLHWTFTGAVLFPDIPEDTDGVYSGSALVNGEQLNLFYTGNVKESGVFDYITSGRQANVIRVVTEDGVQMQEKQVLLRNADYPEYCTCHVRDPKVWKASDGYHMVLGARTKADQGAALFYTSQDLVHWVFENAYSIPDFGYMWECPDYFFVGNFAYLSISPQGLSHTPEQHQNVYSSGYFQCKHQQLFGFTEWDYGFDFYAPQTFETPDHRRILIGWMGISDNPHTNPTTELGWQHCLTLPRELTCSEDGSLLQNPIRELEQLRKEQKILADGTTQQILLPFDGIFSICPDSTLEIRMDDAIVLQYDGNVWSMIFLDAAVGGGRTVRNCRLSGCQTLRILADTSSLECYLDLGKRVMSSRFYPNHNTISVSIYGGTAAYYELHPMQFQYKNNHQN